MAAKPQGYEISYDDAQHILYFRAWGFWNMETAQQFEQEWTEQVKAVSAQGQPWYALIDLTEFPPQKPEVQELTHRMIEFEKQHGVKKEAHLVSQILTKLQITRIAKEAGLAENSFFQTKEDAIAWLLQD